jgi:hypothetical protein
MMRVRMRVIISLCAGVLVAGAAYAQEAPLAKAQACASLPRADQRLACFEAAVAGLRQADTTGGVAGASRQAFGSMRREAADIARAASLGWVIA